jgi:hypothetical protein
MKIKATKKPKKEIVRFNETMKPLIADLIDNIGYDGHTIWKESILKHFNDGIKERFIRNFQSDKSSYKSTIFGNNGKIIEECEGIYGLSLLTTICNDLNLEYEGKIGRGFQAQVCTEAIKKWLAE